MAAQVVASADEAAFLDLIDDPDDEKTMPLDVVMKIEKHGTDENKMVVVAMKTEKTEQDDNFVVVVAPGPDTADAPEKNHGASGRLPKLIRILRGTSSTR